MIALLVLRGVSVYFAIEALRSLKELYQILPEPVHGQALRCLAYGCVAAFVWALSDVLVPSSDKEEGLR